MERKNTSWMLREFLTYNFIYKITCLIYKYILEYIQNIRYIYADINPLNASVVLI